MKRRRKRGRAASWSEIKVQKKSKDDQEAETELAKTALEVRWPQLPRPHVGKGDTCVINPTEDF
jgi:hypothetical protein